MVSPARLELATGNLEGYYSIQLSYGEREIPLSKYYYLNKGISAFFKEKRYEQEKFYFT